jgi:hypothetical protein
VIPARPPLLFAQDAVRLMLDDEVQSAPVEFNVVDAESMSRHSPWHTSPSQPARESDDGKLWLLAVGDFGQKNALTEELAAAMVCVRTRVDHSNARAAYPLPACTRH